VQALDSQSVQVLAWVMGSELVQELDRKSVRVLDQEMG
jgi:hypothetical protein